MIDNAQIARTAATYIREHGLAKGVLLRTGGSDDYHGKEGSACFNGALLIALGGDSRADALSRVELWDAIGDFGRIPGYEDQLRSFRRITEVATSILERRMIGVDRISGPVMWNNDVERTADEVADLLDEVAKELTPSGS